jgi:type IV secretory pathway protease TraF
MKRRTTILVVMLCGVLPLVPTTGAQPVPLYIWNVSESVPPGLYRLRPADTLFVTELGPVVI